MAKTKFKPAPRGMPVRFACPRCQRDVMVENFDIAPVPTRREEDWATAWYLSVYGICLGCEWTGTRAVGIFTTQATGAFAREEETD